MGRHCRSPVTQIAALGGERPIDLCDTFAGAPLARGEPRKVEHGKLEITRPRRNAGQGVTEGAWIGFLVVVRPFGAANSAGNGDFERLGLRSLGEHNLQNAVFVLRGNIIPVDRLR